MRFSIDGDDHLLSDLGGRPFIEGFSKVRLIITGYDGNDLPANGCSIRLTQVSRERVEAKMKAMENELERLANAESLSHVLSGAQKQRSMLATAVAKAKEVETEKNRALDKAATAVLAVLTKMS